MKAARITAILVCGLLAFSMLQGFQWHWRLEPGWQPEWWQSRTWAKLGVLLTFPALFPMVSLQNISIKNAVLQTVLEYLVFAVGLGGEFILSYALPYKAVRFLTRPRKDLRQRLAKLEHKRVSENDVA